MSLPAVVSHRLANRTDARGVVTLSDCPKNGEVGFGFESERFAFPRVLMGVSRLEQKDDQPPFEVRLEPGGSISGRIRYARGGKPATGIRVLVQGKDFGGSHGITDSQGRYRIANLFGGDYDVVLDLDNEVAKNWTSVGREGVKLESGQSLTDVDLTLISGGVISGRVVTEDAGRPLRGATIWVHGPSHPGTSYPGQATRTNADGTYFVRVPAGLQHVQIETGRQERYAPSSLGGDIQVTDGQIFRLDFVLRRINEGPGLKQRR